MLPSARQNCVAPVPDSIRVPYRDPSKRSFDPSSVKCYKTPFHACPCASALGRFAGRIWGILEPARGSIFPVE